MQLNLDFLEKWEHIIAGVSKTDVPLECIKKVVIKFLGQEIDITSRLTKEELSLLDKIETDEIEIEDMTFDKTTRFFTYPCPCGDK